MTYYTSKFNKQQKRHKSNIEAYAEMACMYNFAYIIYHTYQKIYRISHITN